MNLIRAAKSTIKSIEVESIRYNFPANSSIQRVEAAAASVVGRRVFGGCCFFASANSCNNQLHTHPNNVLQLIKWDVSNIMYNVFPRVNIETYVHMHTSRCYNTATSFVFFLSVPDTVSVGTYS